MSQKTPKQHHNKIVLLDRVKLNILALMQTPKTDEQAKIIEKIIERTIKKEIKSNSPCMNVPVYVWELKRLFPNVEEYIF